MKLELVKSDHFGEVQCDFYREGEEIYLTRNQLGAGLGYGEPRKAIADIHARHKDRLDDSTFSTVRKLRTVDGKSREVTLYTRKGVMEVCRWSEQPNANAFMDWAWEVIDSLMRGEAKLVSMTEYQQMMAETRQGNIRVQKARIFERLANQYEGPYRQVLQAYAANELAGTEIIPLPDAPQKDEYTATQIGEMFGLTKDKIGRIANDNGLKIERFGRFCVDKSPYSAKEVKAWRYNAAAIPEFKRILGIA